MTTKREPPVSAGTKTKKWKFVRMYLHGFAEEIEKPLSGLFEADPGLDASGFMETVFYELLELVHTLIDDARAEAEALAANVDGSRAA